MKTSRYYRLLMALLAIAIILTSVDCKRKKAGILIADPKFQEFVSAYTSGIISVESTIRIRLANEFPGNIQPNTPIDKELFDFSPSLKGNSYWVDNSTIEFRPAEKLKGGTIYTCKFYLSKILEVATDLKTFEFGFQTIQQTFAVHMDGFKPYVNDNLIWNKIYGTLVMADVIELDQAEAILSATQGNKKIHVSWNSSEDRKTFPFELDSIERQEKETEVMLSWNGKSCGIELEGQEKFAVPALKDFKLMQAKVVQQPEQFILLTFSDPLAKSQNLDGLIRLGNDVSLSFTITDNEVKVFPATRQTGSLKLYVEEGVKNIMGYRLTETQTISLAFEEVKPAVRLSGNGVILPNSQGLIFPFEAVNLKAVDVKIIRIFENNIAQFLQVNQLDGTDQLKRVGRLILKKEVPLSSTLPIDYGAWNAFSLDLSQLIKQEPGAIYRVELSFRKNQSVYPCAGEIEEDNTEVLATNSEDEMEQEISYWDMSENYYYYGEYDNYYDEDYDYQDRDNPCKSSYYSQRRNVARNILASDLGIIAKGGNDKSMTFAVTNLINTEPLSGVTLEIYNFQKQLITSASTNGDGLATVMVESKPFLLIAKKDEQRGYLRLDDGSSLSLSGFDVSGNAVQKGLKGFIYGERGVWRPGDTLFLTFMLEDKQKLLPAGHPVGLELINPQGQVVKRMNKTSGLNGFYSFTLATSPDAPTGNWTVNVHVGGTLFSKSLKIETIKPNRLKINLDFGKEKLSVLDRDVSGTLKVAWLTGATARNLRTEIKVNLNQARTSFPRYEEFEFDDPARTFSTEEQNIFDGNVNETGEANVSASISVNDAAPGMLQANFVVKAFEESGDFSIDRFSMPYAPYESFVGIRMPKGDKRGMLLTDTMHIIQVVTLDPDGQPVSHNGLEAEVYKLEWQWWWESSSNNLADYIGSSYHAPMMKKTFSTSNGKGSFSFKINYPEWGRFLVRVTDPVSGHASGKIVYVDWPGWAGRSRENPGGAAMLMFSADKTKYTVGDEVNVTFPSPENARALVSVETGTRVLDAWWVKTTKDETRFNFKVTSEMSPNMYISVTMVQPHDGRNNDLPIRMYGVIPLTVENPETHLTPVIDMPDVLQPESNVTIKVQEKEGKPMTYTLAIVDEGLLDLTRFKTPDPWNSFYAREALGVKTWDLYDMVLGAYGGKLQSLLNIGGDEDIQGGAKSKANRFKPVVKFLGPFTLEKGKTAKHTVKLPPYVGSVRTMIVAGNEGAYGFSDKATPVRKPLMILATLPRVLGPGETVKLPVTIFALEKNIREVQVSISGNELLQVQGEKSRAILFSQTGDQVATFDLKVASKLGTGKVKVSARSGSETAETEIELDVRTPNPPAHSFIDAVIDAGKAWESEYQPVGMAGTNKGVLEVSSIPPIDLGRRLQYLLQYPHGCVEQTTSAAFPQLFLSDVMELNANAKAMAEANVKSAIERLRSFMLPDGGFGYWPGAKEASDWASSYAGHFLIEAEAKGFALPLGFKSSWVKYQRTMARNWTANKGKYEYAAYQQSDLEQAYRLYTLALAKEPDLGSMNRLRERKDLTIQAKWRLAAAYALVGQTEAAQSLVNNLATDIKPYNGFYSSYGSMERDWAMILETMSLMNMRDKAISLVKNISGSLCMENWMSTQTTAYCLLSMSKFAGNNGSSKGLKFEYDINGSKTENIATNYSVAQFDIKMKDLLTGKIKLINKGTGVLFARVSLQGIPEAGSETAAANGLSMRIVYKDIDGNSIDPSELEQGTDFMAEVVITNPSIAYCKDMALSQIFPSGWEIYNSRMDGFASVHQADVPTYQDIRDDRVYTYFSMPGNSSRKYIVLLNAAYLGRYYLPAVSCEAMYDSRINARSAGQWIEVVNRE